MKNAGHVAVLLSVVFMLLITGCPNPDPTPGGPDWPASVVGSRPSIAPVAVAVADFNGDDRLDVVSLWRGALPGEGDEEAMVVLHLQTTTFSWQTLTLDADPRYAEANALTVGDIDVDGHPDIVVAGMDRIIYLHAPGNASVVADWEIVEIQASIADEFIAWFDVAVGQIDGVHGRDIVAALYDYKADEADEDQDGRVVWFAAPEDPNTGEDWELRNIDATTRQQADSVLLYDLNNDERLDVISTAPGEATDGVSWYEQPEDPTAEDAAWTKHPMSDFNGATRMALGDLDGDGDPDLAAISPVDQRGAWLVHPADVTDRWGGWVFQDFTVGFDEPFPIDIDIADADADGQNDIFVNFSGPGSAIWYTPTADNTLTWTGLGIAAFRNANLGLMGLGDIDADGSVDVVIPAQDTQNEILDTIYWFANPYEASTP